MNFAVFRSSSFLAILLAAIVAIAPIALLIEMNSHNLTIGGSCGGGPSAESRRSSFCSLTSLKGSSSLIVLATVGDFVVSFHDGGEDSIFQLNVISYLKGSASSPLYLADADLSRDSPLPRTGEEYVLFLTPTPDCSPVCTLPPTPIEQTFWPEGGPQGKFLVQNGLVYGFKTLYPNDSWIQVDANGVPLDQFMAEVQSA